LCKVIFRSAPSLALYAPQFARRITLIAIIDCHEEYGSSGAIKGLGPDVVVSVASEIKEDFTTHPGLALLRPPDERSTTASIHSAATSALSSLVMEEMEALYPDDNQKEKTAVCGMRRPPPSA